MPSGPIDGMKCTAVLRRMHSRLSTMGERGLTRSVAYVRIPAFPRPLDTIAAKAVNSNLRSHLSSTQQLRKSEPVLI